MPATSDRAGGPAQGLLAPKNPKEEGQSTKRLKIQERLHFLNGALYSSHIDPSGAK